MIAKVNEIAAWKGGVEPLPWASMSRWRAGVSLVLLLMMAASSGSQEKSTSETALARLRADFEAALARASVEPLKLRITELQAAEKRAAAAWDWEQALAAREKRQRAEMDLASAEKLSLLLGTVKELEATRGKIDLPLTQATLEGVKYDDSRKALTDWRTTSSRAMWTLPDLPPGGYEVVLRYTSSATQGGTVRVQEQFYSLNADTHITLAGPEDHLLGTLRVRTGSGPLVVSASKVSKGGLMDLYGVQLVPVNE